MVIGIIVGAAFTLLGLIFRNPVMQLVGGAILIYLFGIFKIFPPWMIALLVLLFVFLIKGKGK